MFIAAAHRKTNRVRIVRTSDGRPNRRLLPPPKNIVILTPELTGRPPVATPGRRTTIIQISRDLYDTRYRGSLFRNSPRPHSAPSFSYERVCTSPSSVSDGPPRYVSLRFVERSAKRRQPRDRKIARTPTRDRTIVDAAQSYPGGRLASRR